MLPRLCMREPVLAAEPDLNNPSVEWWESNDGPPVASWREGNLAHLHFPGLARYSFDTSQGDCVAYPSPGAHPRRIAEAYERSVVPILLHARGDAEALHASAVETECGVVAFAARSGTGKSTLAANMARRGFGLWSDDAVAWSMVQGSAVTFALPFISSFECEAAPVRGSEGGASRPLRAVVLLERSVDSCEPALESVPAGAQALALVLPHAYCFGVAESRTAGRTVSDYLALVANVPLYRLTFGTDLNRVPETIELLCDALSLAVDARCGIA
jgi:hypothetical protein